MSNAEALLDLVDSIEDPTQRALASWWLEAQLWRELVVDADVADGLPAG